MNGADLIAKGLAAYGVEHVFAIVSIHNMPILDAINRLGRPPSSMSVMSRRVPMRRTAMPGLPAGWG